MAMRIEWAARAIFIGAAILAGIAALITSCESVTAGGPKMAGAAKYSWKDLWRGTAPPHSPTGAEPGLTLVYGKAAWARVIGPYNRPDETLLNPKVDWGKEVLLSIQANIDNPDSLVHLESITSDGKSATVTAVVRLDPNNPVSREVEVRPWLLAAVPAAAFPAGVKVTFTIDGRPLSVMQER